MRDVVRLFPLWVLAGCAAPVVSEPPPAGRLIAFGGGPGGAQDACFLCHGRQGEGGYSIEAESVRAPALAGQSMGYMVKQLDDYARRKRDDPEMSPIAARLDAQSIHAVSAYYSQLPAPALQPPDADGRGTPGDRAEQLYHQGDPSRGLVACADCHGEAGRGVGPANPALAILSAEYQKVQLHAWKAGTRRNDGAHEMGEIARLLDDREISDLSAFAAGLDR